MTNEETFKQLIAQFGTAFDLPDLQPTPDGYCSLFADDDLAVQLQLDPQSGRVAFFIEIGTVAPEDFARVCPQLLAANALWLGTNGATLGMTTNGRVILGYHEALAQLTTESMTKLIDDLIITAEEWEENLVTLPGNDADPRPSAVE